MEPSVGRIVHYFDRERPGDPLAAVIVAVHGGGVVNLWVFPDGRDRTGLPAGPHGVITSVVYGKAYAADSGAWDWPPKGMNLN